MPERNWYFLVFERAIDKLGAPKVMVLLEKEGAVVEANPPEGFYLLSMMVRPTDMIWGGMGVPLAVVGQSRQEAVEGGHNLRDLLVVTFGAELFQKTEEELVKEALDGIGGEDRGAQMEVCCITPGCQLSQGVNTGSYCRTCHTLKTRGR